MMLDYVLFTAVFISDCSRYSLEPVVSCLDAMVGRYFLPFAFDTENTLPLCLGCSIGRGTYNYDMLRTVKAF